MITTLLFDFSQVLFKGELDEELLDFCKRIKDKYSLYIFSTRVIQDDPELKEILAPIFKRIYSTQDIGVPKSHPVAFKKIAARLAKEPDEILFIDDSWENVEAAKRAGLHALEYTNNEKLLDDLKKLLG